MKKTIALTLASASLLVGGVAIAQTADRGDRGPTTRAQATEMAASRFAKMDVNGDGQLNSGDREARKAARFAKADTNGDGALTQAEMAAAQEARKATREARRAERGDRAEGQHADRRGHGKRGGKHHGMRGGKRMLQMADTNNDGAISQAEFQAAALARFDKADANADGTVTAEEHKAAREAHRAERQANRQSGRRGS